LSISTKKGNGRRSRKESYASIAIIILIVLASFYYYEANRPKAKLLANVNLVLYAGELSSTKYGFGYTANNITSPGPKISFKVGDVVSVTMHNVGKLPHSFEINTQNSTKGQVLFNSEIDPGTFVSPNQTGTVLFKVTKSGSFYYICPVPGHADLGMWGLCNIST
jgi:uncharacterized cupredoxin-like copper-binding protein